jgi:hypothetical protein
MGKCFEKSGEMFLKFIPVRYSIKTSYVWEKD